MTDSQTRNDGESGETTADRYWKRMHEFDLEMRRLAEERPEDRQLLRGQRELLPEQKRLLELKAKLRRLNEQQRNELAGGD